MDSIEIGPTKLEAAPTKPGLRERKKQQTRETIVRVALELFAERGYDETTLAEIAEAADVSPRTIFSYFDSKEEILFCEESSSLEEVKAALEERPEGTTTVDAIRSLLADMPPPDNDGKLRKQVITSSPSLQLKMRARVAELEPVLAASFARDLGSETGDIRALLIAASATAAFGAVHDRLAAEAAGGEIAHDRAMAIVDEVLKFLHAGLERLRTQ
ncbi:MAG: TetR family transcriptional regulator [Solirubrobacterales bacterium]|nr:TetR family transcriptional regulator [Solirubrobacterales bacterium]